MTAIDQKRGGRVPRSVLLTYIYGYIFMLIFAADDCRGFELTLPHDRPDAQGNNTSYISSILISSYRRFHRSSETGQSRRMSNQFLFLQVCINFRASYHPFYFNRK